MVGKMAVDNEAPRVTETCTVRANSKEKLGQAGLISCYDYYMEHHGLKLCWTTICLAAYMVV